MHLNTTLAVTENCRTECQDYISNENVTAGKASINGRKTSWLLLVSATVMDSLESYIMRS
jgi:hypothetical protein